MDFKNKRKSVDKPPCKYGPSCYQKNPEHRKKFKHPSGKASTVNYLRVNSLNNAPTETNTVSTERNTPEKTNADVSGLNSIESHSIQLSESSDFSDNDQSPVTEETVERILKSMPKDFLDFWKFCGTINKSNPEDAFLEYDYKLVGPFDLLARKLPKNMKVDISCHWRYYFDPPEFQTILKKNGYDWYHIGYFRDDPSDKSLILASNCAAKDSKLCLMGDNIFCAMNIELTKVLKILISKESKSKASKLQRSLVEFANTKKYDLNITTKQTEKRRKKVVANTFHSLGIVVPVKNNVGYRPLPNSNAVLKNILQKIASAENETKRLQHQETLDKIITYVHFANDECDYGMGLELGIDLFCYGNPYFHQDILRILTVAYDLLNRSKYASIVKAHLSNRTKGENLSTLNV